MALVRKTDPIDIDDRIDEFQVYLFNNISIAGLTNATEWESYPRAYSNPLKAGQIPELYIGEGEYKEVFYDDTFKMSSFFLASNNRTMVNGLMVVEISLIVQADIIKCFPSILHRADEELNNKFVSASEMFSGGDQFELDTITNGVENVYKEFNTEDVRFDDMSNQYIARFDYTVTFTPQC